MRVEQHDVATFGPFNADVSGPLPPQRARRRRRRCSPAQWPACCAPSCAARRCGTTRSGAWAAASVTRSSRCGRRANARAQNARSRTGARLCWSVPLKTPSQGIEVDSNHTYQLLRRLQPTRSAVYLAPCSNLVTLLPWPPVQEAGVPMKLARSIGIAVDHRRRNRSLESLQVRCRPEFCGPAAAAAFAQLAGLSAGCRFHELVTPMRWRCQHHYPSECPYTSRGASAVAGLQSAPGCGAHVCMSSSVHGHLAGLPSMQLHDHA